MGLIDSGIVLDESTDNRRVIDQVDKPIVDDNNG